jgi:transposase
MEGTTMARPRLPIALHLDHDEIARRYRACRSGLEKTHWQILGLLTGPEAPTPEQVAGRVGLTPGWVRTILKRWNADGPSGLADRRVATNGGHSKLTTDQQVELWDALQRPPRDGGLWTGPKVAAYVRDRWGVAVCKQTGWEWLRGLGFSLQVPRPSHPEAATPAAPRAWKRRPGGAAGRIEAAAPRAGRRAVGRG